MFHSPFSGRCEVTGYPPTHSRAGEVIEAEFLSCGVRAWVSNEESLTGYYVGKDGHSIHMFVVCPLQHGLWRCISDHGSVGVDGGTLHECAAFVAGVSADSCVRPGADGRLWTTEYVSAEVVESLRALPWVYDVRPINGGCAGVILVSESGAMVNVFSWDSDELTVVLRFWEIPSIRSYVGWVTGVKNIDVPTGVGKTVYADADVDDVVAAVDEGCHMLAGKSGFSV